MVTSTQTIAEAMAAADRALVSRDPAKALALLEAEVERQPVELDFWRKLASLRRIAGDTGNALSAIDAALSLAPLDFVSLLLRAELLERMGVGEAGEAYGRALAQQPRDGVPKAMAAAVARAEGAWAAHQLALERRLELGFASSGAKPEPAANKRIERFITNTSRRTRTYHSEPTHFSYPELREREFHDRSDFPWLERWEAATETIAEEFSVLVAAKSAELVPYVQYGSAAPLAQWRTLNHSDKWSTFHLIQRGEVNEANAQHCPKTMALLEEFPQPRIVGCGANAMFSLLAPQTVIPPHTGVANFRLVCHLALIVPANCEFRVGATTRSWKRGEAWVFDDTIEHEAANHSDELRVVMIIDCWHPDLDAAEREAITAIVSEAAIQATML